GDNRPPWRSGTVYTDRSRRQDVLGADGSPRVGGARVMIRTRVAVIAMLALSATLASCGPRGGPALYPVTGKVTYKGEPAAGAQVVLAPDGPPAPGAPGGGGEPPSAIVEEDGRFTVSSGDRGDGAPPGKYKVLITWRTGLAADAAKADEATAKK